jgi:hypothetical protein
MTESPSSMIAVIERAAINPDIDINKMTALLDMQERIMVKQSEMAFNTAMNLAQAQMPRIKKNGKIEFTDKNGVKRDTPFAKYEDIDQAIRPIYELHGFSIRFNTDRAQDGKTIVIMKVAHIDGHVETSSMELPLDTSGSKNNLQAAGSTIAYARRYLTCMGFNIVTEGQDDDGQGATDFVTTEQAAEIDNLIRSTGADLSRFLAYIGAKDVLSILAKDYQTAITGLNSKKPKQQGGVK